MTQEEAFSLAVHYLDVSKSTRVLQECDGFTAQNDKGKHTIVVHTKGVSVVIYQPEHLDLLANVAAQTLSGSKQTELAKDILNHLDAHERKLLLTEFIEVD